MEKHLTLCMFDVHSGPVKFSEICLLANDTEYPKLQDITNKMKLSIPSETELKFQVKTDFIISK
eukprot:UN10583